jgi:fibronectin-binding autotransporter adhesin
MSGTISTTITSTYTLAVNPTMVTNTGAVLVTAGSALYGPGGTAWTVTNMGAVLSSGDGGAGVSLVSGGSVANQVSGLISASGPGHAVGVTIAAAGSVTNAGLISGYYGVYLGADGGITNLSGGQITGSWTGVVLARDAANSVVNAGTILAGKEFGVYAGFGGTGGHSLNNTGSIVGGAGVLLGGQNNTVTNAGVIRGAAGAGLDVSGGAVTNTAGGLIESTGLDLGAGLVAGVEVVIANLGTISADADRGVFLQNNNTLFNSGLVQGGAASLDAGIYIVDGGLVQNASSAVIVGYSGIDVVRTPVLPGTVMTIDNAGTIEATGNAGYAVRLSQRLDNLVINRPGAAFIGVVDGGIPVPGGTGASTLELAAGTVAGTLTGLGTQFIDFPQITVDAGANWVFDNSDTVVSGSTLTNSGSVSGGVTLAAAAVLNNTAGGTISNASRSFYGISVYGSGAPSTILNAGIIGYTGIAFGEGTGVSLQAGGTVVNTAGNIVGKYGIRIDGGPGTVVNSAGINAGFLSNTGIDLVQGGLVVNNPGGRVDGDTQAISIGGRGGTLLNAGQISGGDFGSALYMAGGLLYNEAGGSIADTVDGSGAGMGGGGTVVNDGLIAGGGPHGGGGLGLSDGASLTNLVEGSISGLFGVGAGANVTITNFGVIGGGGEGINIDSGGGVQIGNGGLVDNRAGATIEGPTAVGLSMGGTVVNAGTIVGGGRIIVALDIAGGADARVVMAPGAVFEGKVDGGNTIGATAVSTFEMAAGTAPGTVTAFGSQFVNFGSIQFDTGTDWLLSGNTAGVAAGETISGFTVGDRIEITGVTEQFQSFSDGTLSLTGSQNLQLLLTGTYDPSDFLVLNTGPNTEITVTCFAQGTRIATPNGAMTVEALAVGDLVLTHTGAAKPIIWRGHRHIDCTQHPKPALVWPVRVRADAFGPRQPSADLYLSPEHCIYVNNVLIPVKHLIDGLTVEQVQCAEVTYYHLELPRHDVVLAEGLPVESYLDTDGRTNFANGGGVVRLFPDFASLSDDTALLWEATGFAPRHVVGPEVEAARSLLMQRAKRQAATGRSGPRSRRTVAG